MTREMDSLLLRVQAALLDSVTPVLRAVVVDFDAIAKKEIFSYYYDGPISDELFNLASVATTEAALHFIEEHILQLDSPARIPVKGRLAFLRQEPGVEKYRAGKDDFLDQSLSPVARLSLILQQALLGRVSPTLRAVSASIDPVKQRLGVYFVYDGEISEKNVESVQDIVSEMGQFYPLFTVEHWVSRLDSPAKVQFEGRRIAFCRKENP